ncbi:MAG: sugar kinase [Calditrichales bacterium]|nr:MAG: sugar kinase [Calditrichales bacterium]
MNILVVGSLAFDTVHTPFGSVEDSPGGSAMFFSNAASFFAPVNVVGVVGNDFDINKIDMGKNRPINFDGVYAEDGKTFRWGGRYYDDPNKRDTLFTHLNVFENFKPSIPAAYQKSDVVFLANIDPDLQLQVLDQMEKPKLVVMDTMNFWISGKRDSLEKVIRKCDILILNDEETRQLTGEINLISGGEKVLEMGPDVVVIKKGEHGAVMMKKDAYFVAPAFPVRRVVDPTGAGDVFAGGFVGYLAKSGNFSDQALRKAIIYGTVVASFNVEDFSFKRLAALTEEELETRFAEIKKITDY